MGDDNKYAGDEPRRPWAHARQQVRRRRAAGDPGTTPDNKYAGDEPAGDPGTTPDSSGDPTPDQDSGITPENKYAG